MAKQLLFLNPKRFFRASQNMNKLFNVYIDDKPVQVSTNADVIKYINFAVCRSMLHTPSSRLASRLESRSQDSATMKDFQSLVTAECASLRSKEPQNHLPHAPHRSDQT